MDGRDDDFIIKRRLMSRKSKKCLLGICGCLALFVVVCLVCILGVNSKNDATNIKDDANFASSRVDAKKVTSTNLGKATNKKKISKQTRSASKKSASKNNKIIKKDVKARKTKVKKKVYLTFDDGPSDLTSKVLDTLKKYNVKATFFVIAKTDKKSKAIYKRICDEGHTLAMHSYSHNYKKIYSSLASFKKDVVSLENLLLKITGIRPIYYRFPGGSSNTVSNVSIRKCIKYLNQRKIKYFDWNALNGDAEGKKYSVKQLVNNVMKDVKANNNSVVLMHDTNAKKTTLNSLPDLIKQLKGLDCTMLPIDDNTPLIQHVKASSVK